MWTLPVTSPCSQQAMDHILSLDLEFFRHDCIHTQHVICIHMLTICTQLLLVLLLYVLPIPYLTYMQVEVTLKDKNLPNPISMYFHFQLCVFLSFNMIWCTCPLYHLCNIFTPRAISIWLILYVICTSFTSTSVIACETVYMATIVIRFYVLFFNM